jgi:tetratricopeptide (TPR) repeat protein
MKRHFTQVFGICTLLAAILCAPVASAENTTTNATPMVLSGPDIEAINAYNQGGELAAAGNYTGALAETEKALSLQPNFSLAWTQKAGLLVVLGMNNEAITAADTALSGNPDISEAWANRADALYNLGRYQDAVGSAQKAVELDPNMTTALAIKNLAENMINQSKSATVATTVPVTKAGASLPLTLIGLCGAGILFCIAGKRK